MPYNDPAKMADYMRQYRKRKSEEVNVNPVNPSVNRKPTSPLTVNPSVNPVNEKYLLSYSRNKYQFVLYSIDPSGRKNLIKSCRKNEKIKLGPCEIQLTWGPDLPESEKKEVEE